MHWKGSLTKWSVTYMFDCVMERTLFLCLLLSVVHGQTATPTPTPTCVPDFGFCTLDPECCNNLCAGNECCPATWSNCNNECIDTNTNPDHCGGCNAPCPPGFRNCVGGICLPSVTPYTLLGELSQFVSVCCLFY